MISVFSKKSGRADDLSVTSFADLGMYRDGSSTDDVVRKKQPVLYGPRNQRGRRPSFTSSEDSAKKFTSYSIKLPSRYVTTLTPNASLTHEIVNDDDSLAAKQLILEVKQSACDLGKFRDVPCGVGLREQMLGDYNPRPARIRGRPRKAEGNDDACDGEMSSGEIEEVQPDDRNEDVCFEDLTGNEVADADTSGISTFLTLHGLKMIMMCVLLFICMFYVM